MHDKLINENENVIEQILPNISLVFTIFMGCFFLNLKKEFRINNFE